MWGFCGLERRKQGNCNIVRFTALSANKTAVSSSRDTNQPIRELHGPELDTVFSDQVLIYFWQRRRFVQKIS